MDQSGTVQLIETEPGIIDILCQGQLIKEHASYLLELEQLVRGRTELFLHYRMTETTAMAPAFAMAHVDPFKRWLRQVPKVAISHTLVAIGLAVGTVRLASGANLRAFKSAIDAVAWLKE